MKKLLTIALAACALAPALAQTSVGVTIGINQPGVYGQINIGNFPQPRLVYPQPVVIGPSQGYFKQAPIYLYVPPGHQQNWAKHCSRYNACGHPVYFVQEDWVRERYDAEQRGDSRGDGRGDHDRGRGNGKDKHSKGNKHGRDD